MSAPTPSKTPVERAHSAWLYATRPTLGTLFLRTFIPWQIWRFIVINLKMVAMIRSSHRGQHN